MHLIHVVIYAHHTWAPNCIHNMWPLLWWIYVSSYVNYKFNVLKLRLNVFVHGTKKKKNETHEEKNCEHFGGFESAGLLKRYSLTVFDFLAHKFNAHPINYDCISNVIGACCLGKLDGVPFVYTILLRKPQK